MKKEMSVLGIGVMAFHAAAFVFSAVYFHFMCCVDACRPGLTMMFVLVYILYVWLASFFAAVVLFIVPMFFVKKKRLLLFMIWIVLSVIAGLVSCIMVPKKCASARGAARSVERIPKTKALARPIDVRFILAVAKSDLDVMKKLLDKGADLNAKDAFGKTALQWAKDKG